MIEDWNKKPSEIANAEHIEEVCLKNFLTLLQYEDLANFFTQEPPYIRIKQKEIDKNFHNFKQVLRVRIWIPNHSTESWCIYSENREWNVEDGNMGGIIVRHVFWDRKFDINKVKKEIEIESLNQQWPCIKSENTYLKPDDVEELINHIFKNMDLTLMKGITLDKRMSQGENPWSDIEIMRTFDWGQVKSTWNQSMVCEELEDCIFGLGPLMQKNFLRNIHENVYRMQLDYSCPTEIMKKLVQGKSE